MSFLRGNDKWRIIAGIRIREPSEEESPMKTVKQLLASKPILLWSIPPNATTYDAIKMLAEKSVGALPVMQGDKLIGMFSERDYARKVVLKGKSSVDTPVSDVMSTQVVCVRPEQTNEDCMALMTDKRIRHLPVIENERVVGVISIGDLVKDIISEQKFVIEQLEHYIMS
jgi:predicted transcriptional regulator